MYLFYEFPAQSPACQLTNVQTLSQLSPPFFHSFGIDKSYSIINPSAPNTILKYLK